MRFVILAAVTAASLCGCILRPARTADQISPNGLASNGLRQSWDDSRCVVSARIENCGKSDGPFFIRLGIKFPDGTRQTDLHRFFLKPGDEQLVQSLFVLEGEGGIEMFRRSTFLYEVLSDDGIVLADLNAL